MQYEIFYLIGASKEADLDNIKNGVEKIISDAEGKFLEKETIEKRRLSYVVKKETHGIYIARRFELEDTSKLEKITAKLNLNPDVARFILSRADELPELKSKEERISESAKKEERQKRAMEAAEKTSPKSEKTATKNEKNTSSEEKSTSKKESDTKEIEKEEKIKNDDIDKKLEEILNI